MADAAPGSVLGTPPFLASGSGAVLDASGPPGLAVNSSEDGAASNQVRQRKFKQMNCCSYWQSLHSLRSSETHSFALCMTQLANLFCFAIVQPQSSSPPITNDDLPALTSLPAPATQHTTYSYTLAQMRQLRRLDSCRQRIEPDMLTQQQSKLLADLFGPGEPQGLVARVTGGGGQRVKRNTQSSGVAGLTFVPTGPARAKAKAPSTRGVDKLSFLPAAAPAKGDRRARDNGDKQDKGQGREQRKGEWDSPDALTPSC